MKVLKRFEGISTPSFTFISSKRVYTITKEIMFFLIRWVVTTSTYYILVSNEQLSVELSVVNFAYI